MSVGNVAPEEIHSVNVCPACEFSSMKMTLVYVEHDIVSGRIVNHYRRVETWECRGCGFEEDYEFYEP